MNIYVGNLAHSVTEETLKTTFEQYGQVVTVKIIQDRFTGAPRGFAFVEMADREEAHNAITELNGADLEGRKIIAKKARPRQAQGAGGGGGGGGGRGGFGGGGRY